MSTKTLTRAGDLLPSVFDDFFKPWNEWYRNSNLWGKPTTVPAVNISETKNAYLVSVAAPGLKKNDFHIDVQGSMLTVSCEKEEDKEEKNDRYNRKEYSYTCFSRSFAIPEEVKQEHIEAAYNEGILTLTLPKKENNGKTPAARHIDVK